MTLRSAAPPLLALVMSLVAVGCMAGDSAPGEKPASLHDSIVLESNFQGSGMDRINYSTTLGTLEALVYAAPGCHVGEGGSNCPVIIFHHGDGQNGGVQNQFSDGNDIPSLIKGGYRPAGLIIAAPARYLGWANGRIADFTAMQDGLLGALPASYKVDPGAVHVTGLSGGSTPTLAYAMKRPGKIASYSVFDGVMGFEPCNGGDPADCLLPADVPALVALPSFWATGWGDTEGTMGTQNAGVAYLTSHGGSLSSIQQFTYCSSGTFARDANIDWATLLAFNDSSNPRYCGFGIGHIGWKYGYSHVTGQPHSPTWWDWVASTFPPPSGGSTTAGAGGASSGSSSSATTGSGGAGGGSTTCVGAGGVLKNSCFAAVDEGASAAATALLDGTLGYADDVSWLGGKWLFASEYPASAYIDLKGTYTLSKLEYFAGNHGGSSSVEISYATAAPSGWTVLANSPPTAWNGWVTGSTSAFKARYIRLRFTSYAARFNIAELRLTGGPS